MNACCEKMKEFAPLFLRLGLGVIFVYHGYGKVFGEGHHFGTAWNPSGMSPVLQGLVSAGEFLGGLGIFSGVLVEFVALGIIIIMIGAIATVHWKNGFSMMNGGFEYNFALISMCLALICTGAGKFSPGKCCKRE